MVFSSNVFLYLFLPIFLAAYYAVPFRWRSAVILAGSIVFYGWWRVDFAALFLLVIAVNYVISHQIAKTLGTAAAGKWLMLGVTLNLSTLGYFKYFNLLMDGVNHVAAAMGGQEWSVMHVLLPIGISFYIFHSISFLVDVYRRDAPPARNFFDFAAFIALFPQLVAGPVLRYKDVAPQFLAREHSWEKFNLGAQRFMIGFCKKILIADTVAPIANAAFALENPTFADAWIGTIAYAVQLYFDFSGYSDMAIGLGLMIGFRFMENFNHPYVSRSITEFWRRWHISLSTWLRDYLYIPLGGNRKGVARTYFNLWATMVLGGLWHGANWTFLLWGIWHGTILAIERYLGVDPGAASPTRFHYVSRVALCTVLVLLGWVTFRAPDFDTAMTMYAAMAGLSGFWIGDDFLWQLGGMSLTALGLGIFLFYFSPWLEARLSQINPKDQIDYHTRNWPVWVQLGLIALFLLAVLKLSAQSYTPFLYFQF